jgi:hypothetical protein
MSASGKLSGHALAAVNWANSIALRRIATDTAQQHMIFAKAQFFYSRPHNSFRSILKPKRHQLSQKKFVIVKSKNKP